MPQTWENAFYLILYVIIAVSCGGVIPWLINKGFNAMTSKMSNMESGLNALRVDIQSERESRLVHYGSLESKIAAHKAVCDERHGHDRRGHVQ